MTSKKKPGEGGPSLIDGLPAVHEAGHAVMNDYAGYRITGLQLRLGYDKRPSRAGHEAISAERVLAMDDALRLHLATMVAGMVAERILLFASLPDANGVDAKQWNDMVRLGGETDLRQLSWVQRRGRWSEERFNELVREAQQLAEDVLQDRWPAVIDVASAALQAYKKRLAGWEVRQIIKHALAEVT